MGLKINKRIKICKGLHLNVGKNGISTSVKVGKVTYNSKGRVTANIAKGVSYSTNIKQDKKTKNEVQASKKTFLEKIEEFNNKVNSRNEKLEIIRVNRANKNIDQWEAIGRKIPFLRGLANFMVNVNKKQLNKN